ncbi:AraC family transcriptional regulator [Chengkuizengella axinellae]|uniref:AraC family transcriptional regulator n=1 Tax=Chengkuizengella axinellae TaxID=3064388 RepID=A0ABT9ITB6_9BACL|nr:AraC family transcriptional regulator [Chengkuizengella sp. 2205SS18-9]MDP5272604.1 AraC family transcriptional regulator [Chengkuizengella sp. 2205SS18-9]
MKRKSLLTKLIIFGCILSIIPVLFVGTFSYIQSSKQVQKQINLGEIQYIKQLNLNIEQIFVTLNHTLNNLIDSTVMEQALHSDLNYREFQLYNNLRKEISHLQSFDSKVSDVVILSKEEDWLVKNSGLYRLKDHDDYNKYMEFFELNANSNWELLNSNDFSDNFFNASCEYSISLVKKLPVRASNKDGLAFAHIPTCSISEMITKEREFDKVMIIDDSNRILVHEEQDMIGKSLIETTYFNEEIDFDQNSGQFHLTVDNHEYTATYYKSDFNGWIYLSVVSLDNLTVESKKIGWFTIYICVFIILISILFVWLTTRKLYSPIGKLIQFVQERLPNENEKPQSELQFIEKHMQELFSSNSKLEDEIRDHKQQVRSLFISRLLTGNIRSSEMTGKLEYFGLQERVHLWKRIAMLSVQIDSIENTRFENKDVDLLYFAISNIVEEIISKDNRLPSVWIDQTLSVLVGFEVEDIKLNNDRIYKLTETIQGHIWVYLGLSVSIGISLMYEDISFAPRAYQEGLEALKHRIKLGTGVIIRYGNVSSTNHSIVIQYPQIPEMELLDAIKLSDQEEAITQLNSWMDIVFNQSQTLNEYQVYLMRLLNNIMIMMQEASIPYEQIYGRRTPPHEELLKLQVRDDVEDWFKNRLVLPLIQIFGDRRDSLYQNLSEEMIDMIHTHYDKELTLEECASKLHYNANYLSSVFKKETNSTFSEYLSNYRFRMAKQWLLTSEMTIKEIADRLKYNNSQNFIRSFKKQEGMTPGQYRKKYKD